jgi:hypothetical protein
MQLDQWPVIQPSTSHRVFIDPKAKWLDQVQCAARSRTQASDIAGIGRYLRLDEYHVEWSRAANRAQALVGGQ